MYFEGEEELEGLDTVEASVNKISDEEVVGLRALTTDVEELDHVPELAVDVATNLGLVKLVMLCLTVTGASTLCTLLSSTKISLALAQRSLTSDSLRKVPFLRVSICLSSSEVDISLGQSQ